MRAVLFAGADERAGEAGAAMQELMQVLPGRSRDYVKMRLEELRDDGAAEVRAKLRQARWHIVHPAV